MDLQTILSTLKTRPHCIAPMHAESLQSRIEQYLAGDFDPAEIKKSVRFNLNTKTAQNEDGTPKVDVEITEKPYGVRNGVAIIGIDGVVMKRVGLPQEILEYFGIVDLDNVDAQLRAAGADPEVKSVLLNVTSPGGFVTGVASTANLVAELASVKETVVYSDVLNASAAYWISSQASSIITSVDADIGSIGVYNIRPDYSQAFANEGIKVELFKAGKYKAMGVTAVPLTDEQRAFMQAEVDSIYKHFTEAVTSKRQIAVEDMQGQTFDGWAAVEKNLADGIASSIEEVIAALSAE